MSGIKNFFRRHFGGGDVAIPVPDDKRFSTTALLRVLVVWMILWTLVPALGLGNVSVDIAENVAWGQNFDWGYDKNPYFGAWFTFAVFKIVPTSIAEYVFYWLSQLSVQIGLFTVYLIGREIFEDRFSAFFAVVAALLIPVFSNSAFEFNDDVMCIALYGLTTLFYLRGVKRNDWGNWLAFGLCAGLAMMTKYLAGVLLLPLAILLFATPDGRKCLKKPWVYLGTALCILLIVPNVVWLIRHDFVAFTYAFGRAEINQPRTMDIRLENFVDTWKHYGVFMILPTLALLIFRRGGRRTGKFGFDQWFVLTVGLAPTILSSLFALATGGRVMVPWTIPYYLFVTLPLVMFYRPAPGKRSLKAFTGLMATAAVLMVLIFGYGHLYRHLYRRRSCNHNVYPGREIAARLTTEWHRRFDRPCPYVIGRRKQACNMCYYSPDHPRGFFEHDLRQSPWIDPDDVRKRGAIIMWHDEKPPECLKKYGSRLIYLDKIEVRRAVPLWMRSWAPPAPKYVIQAALLPPESDRP